MHKGRTKGTKRQGNAHHSHIQTHRRKTLSLLTHSLSCCQRQDLNTQEHHIKPLIPLNMFSWLQPLISVAVFVLPYFLTPPSQAPNGLISQATLEYIESIRLKYDVPGISIGIIASPHSTRDGWKNETHGFGYMNSQGRPVDGDVSLHSTISKASG
jgi:hypothetical protein